MNGKNILLNGLKLIKNKLNHPPPSKKFFPGIKTGRDRCFRLKLKF
nr:MAG TPA: hypothetical protein [Caudoviricetes sp.]